MAVALDCQQHRGDADEQVGLPTSQFQIPLFLEFRAHVLQLLGERDGLLQHQTRQFPHQAELVGTTRLISAASRTDIQKGTRSQGQEPHFGILRHFLAKYCHWQRQSTICFC